MRNHKRAPSIGGSGGWLLYKRVHKIPQEGCSTKRFTRKGQYKGCHKGATSTRGRATHNRLRHTPNVDNR